MNPLALQNLINTAKEVPADVVETVVACGGKFVDGVADLSGVSSHALGMIKDLLVKGLEEVDLGDAQMPLPQGVYRS